MSQEEFGQGQPPNSRGARSTAVVLPALLLYAKTISVILRQGSGCGCPAAFVREPALPTAPADPHLACCAQVTSNSGNAISPAAWVKGVGGLLSYSVCPQGPSCFHFFFLVKETKPLRVVYCMMKRKKKYLMFPLREKKKTVYFVLCKVFIK